MRARAGVGMVVSTVLAVGPAVVLLSACVDLHTARVHVVTATKSPPPPASPAASSTGPSPSVALVRWRGPVEQLFVHPLVLRPDLAFTGDALGRGFADYFVTVREFHRILDQVWRNGWTLVDPQRVAAGDVRVPHGRRPLVLQEDDANYYACFDGRGLASRLVLDEQGEESAQ